MAQRLRRHPELSGPLGNVIDQYATPSAHGNAQGRSAFIQMGYRDGRKHDIVSCAVVTPNLH